MGAGAARSPWYGRAMQFISAPSDEAARALLAGPRLRDGIGHLPAPVLAERGGALRAHGLTHAIVELHGPVAEAHAVITRSVFGDGTPTSFDEALAALAHARTHALERLVVTRVSRSSARVLRELGALLARLGAARWIVILPWHEPALAPPQLPRAALTLPFALEAAQRTSEAGTPTVLVGAPLCLVGPHAHRVQRRGGAGGGPCDGCAARSVCAGLGPSYAALFGTAELRPLAEAPAPATDDLVALVLDQVH